MKSLGIAIKKNEVFYTLIEGTSKENVVNLNSGKQNYRSESETLMLDFSNLFIELITKYRPDTISYKLSLDINMKQIPYMHFSLGVLNLLCLQNGITILERSSRWITANKRSKINEFETKFPMYNFKNEELASAVISWFGLED